MGQCAHLKNYAVIPACEVVAVAELRSNLARRVAQKYGIPRVYGDAADMLRNEDLDGIVCIQPFMRQGVILPDLYATGLPVLTEKPLAASIAAGEKLLSALEAGGSWHMVTYHKRSDPATMYAKREIERLQQTGELGAMRYVRITMPPGDWIAAGFDDLLRSDEPLPLLEQDPPAQDMDAEAFKHYVTFVNYYIHQVNLLRYLLGEPYRVTFADRAGVLLVAESQSGVTGVIEMAPYQTSLDWQETAMVSFERGYVRIDLPAPLASNRPGNVEVFTDKVKGDIPMVSKPQLPWVSAMRQQAINYVRAIRGEARPPCEAPEALEDLCVARDYLRLWNNV
ncbi:MAG: Gfo/Idh/MocA family protein [Anaerolineae bacterium]